MIEEVNTAPLVVLGQIDQVMPLWFEISCFIVACILVWWIYHYVPILGMEELE